MLRSCHALFSTPGAVSADHRFSRGGGGGGVVSCWPARKGLAL